MLRRLDVKEPWRSLKPGYWPTDIPLGGRTVLYGHNGSGKSTLAELLLHIAENDAPVNTVWEDDAGKKVTLQPGDKGPAIGMAVFTRKWVQENLAAFLDGEGASAIVTLGRDAIEAKGTEERLAAEIEDLEKQASEADRHRKQAAKDVKDAATQVQDKIIAGLKQFDYDHFTKNRYSVPNVTERLRSWKGQFPTEEACAEALARLDGDAPTELADVVGYQPTLSPSFNNDLAEILSDTPTRLALATLDGNPVAQRWVEEGISLHSDYSECLFCASEVTPERREQLARHFDESWMSIRQLATDMRSKVQAEAQSLQAWRRAFPEADSLEEDLRAAYEQAIATIDSKINPCLESLTKAETCLNDKINDPSSTPPTATVSVAKELQTATVPAGLISEHNDRARRHAELSAERRDLVLDHIVGSVSASFVSLCQRSETLEEDFAGRSKAVEVAMRELEKVRQAQFTTKHMADTLTHDLARVYGKNHLSVEVTEDGKSYACRRGQKSATDLSEGERTTLSLLYFLRKLEDEQTSGVDPAQRIVVVDDPSSSLDRESLFATHQWLVDTLAKFGQFIVLTHDFGLLRLFLKSQKNAWGSSMKAIRKQDADEIRFPRVSFLEMYASDVGDDRQSAICQLPEVLLRSTSEYAYLFQMVMAGVAEPDDHDRLFLLPNAARRVLEIFASYKAPHRSDFKQQLEVLVAQLDGEPFRDVYDFCNRYSHGEGHESVDVLDARTVYKQIRRCLEFLRALDEAHFANMCEATKVDPSVLG